MKNIFIGILIVLSIIYIQRRRKRKEKRMELSFGLAVNDIGRQMDPDYLGKTFSDTKIRILEDKYQTEERVESLIFYIIVGILLVVALVSFVAAIQEKWEYQSYVKQGVRVTAKPTGSEALNVDGMSQYIYYFEFDAGAVKRKGKVISEEPLQLGKKVEIYYLPESEEKVMDAVLAAEADMAGSGEFWRAFDFVIAAVMFVWLARENAPLYS